MTGSQRHGVRDRQGAQGQSRLGEELFGSKTLRRSPTSVLGSHWPVEPGQAAGAPALGPDVREFCSSCAGD